MNFTQEQLTKARQAKSAEELLTYAKEISYPLTEEEAKHYFEQWHKEGELSEEELDNVTGGTCYGDGWDGKDRPIVTDSNACGLYEAYHGHTEWTVGCFNCKYCSYRVDGVIITEISAYCTNDKRIEGHDIINP